jgi:hypothetical protein
MSSPRRLSGALVGARGLRSSGERLRQLLTLDFMSLRICALDRRFLYMIGQRRGRVLVAAGALALLAACGDSAGPSNATTRAIALHLDSLEAQVCTGPLRDVGYRCIFLEALASVPASGEAPSSVSMITKSGTETWTGVVIEHPETTATGALQDSVFYVLAYPDSGIHTGVIGEYTNGGTTLLSVNVMYSDTGVAIGQTATGTASVGRIGASCSGPPAGLIYPLPDASSPLGTCNVGQFRIAMQATVTGAPGLDSSLLGIMIAPQTINGVRHILPLEVP